MTSPWRRLLVVEDDPDDVFLTKQALSRLPPAVELHAVKDGQEILTFLRKEGRFQDAPTPDLVVIDLDMDKLDGRTVLTEMKADSALRRIPVIVLTASTSEHDVDLAYELGAAGYVVRPSSFSGLVEVLDGITRYWFSTVRGPSV